MGLSTFNQLLNLEHSICSTCLKMMFDLEYNIKKMDLAVFCYIVLETFIVITLFLF